MEANMRIKKTLGGFVKIWLILILCASFGIIFTPKGGTRASKALAEESEGVNEMHDLDVIVLDKDDFAKRRKGPVRFEHMKHARDYNISCWDCHHEYEDGKNVWSPWETTLQCADCHDPETKEGNIVKLQTAFHLCCKTCHEKRKIFGDNPLAYRKCNTCHEKAE
jgi:hypothetical protein